MVDYAMLSRELHQEEADAGAVAFVVGRDAVIPVFSSENPHIDLILKRGITDKQAPRYMGDRQNHHLGTAVGHQGQA